MISLARAREAMTLKRLRLLEELLLLADLVRVAKGVRSNDDVALLALVPLDRVHGAANHVGERPGRTERLLEAADDADWCWARWGVTTPTALSQNACGV